MDVGTGEEVSAGWSGGSWTDDQPKYTPDVASSIQGMFSIEMLAVGIPSCEEHVSTVKTRIHTVHFRTLLSSNWHTSTDCKNQQEQQCLSNRTNIAYCHPLTHLFRTSSKSRDNLPAYPQWIRLFWSRITPNNFVAGRIGSLHPALSLFLEASVRKPNVGSFG